MLVGGLWSIIKLLKPIIEGLADSINNKDTDLSTNKDIPLKIILCLLLILFFPLLSIYINMLK